MCIDPTPIEHFWLMQMLGNFGAKRNFIILYFLTPSPAKIYFCATERTNIHRRWKQIQHFSKKSEYYSPHNVLHYECYHCQTKLFSPSRLLILFKVQLSSEYVLKQEFKPKYA